MVLIRPKIHYRQAAWDIINSLPHKRSFLSRTESFTMKLHHSGYICHQTPTIENFLRTFSMMALIHESCTHNTFNLDTTFLEERQTLPHPLFKYGILIATRASGMNTDDPWLNKVIHQLKSIIHVVIIVFIFSSKQSRQNQCPQRNARWWSKL